MNYLLKVERQYEELYKKIKRWTYKGRPTKKALKLKVLEQRMERGLAISRMLPNR